MSDKKNHKQHFNELKFKNYNNKLLFRIQSLDKENLKCCDCKSTVNVDWISVNLLCVLCIKCSGVHRSLGSHISKIRSLKLDKFDDNLELNCLIANFTSNSFVNEIYESNLNDKQRLNPNCTDSQRLDFIKQKYKEKRFIKRTIDVDWDYNQILTNFLDVLKLNNIWRLHRFLSKLTKINLKQLSINYRNDFDSTLFQLSLNYFRIQNNNNNNHKLFIITEYLLWNDMIIDKDKDNFVIDSNISNDNDDNNKSEISKYWISKVKTFGLYDSSQAYKSPSLSNNNSFTTTSNNTNTSHIFNNTLSRSKSKKKWSLSSIPKASTQNIMTLHNALKNIKDNTIKK